MWKIDKGSKTGTTTNAYISALDWTAEELREKTILLKNTATLSSLKCRLFAYAVSRGIGSEEIGETTLLAGEIAKIQMVKQWAQLLLQVMDGSGRATYQIDYIGQGA